MLVLAGLAACAFHASADGEGEYALPKSKIHVGNCYKAVADMKLGKVDQITGFRERDTHYFRLVITDAQGGQVSAICDGNTGKLVDVRRE